MTSYRLYDGVSGRPGVGSSGTQPPVASTSFGGGIVLSTMFRVTSGPIWMEGYWFYRADSAAPSAAQTFALWSVTWDVGSVPHGYLVPNTTLTSGTLSVGWNYVPFPTPIPLSQGMIYRAQTGLTGNFPDSLNQFGAGKPYAAGITNGPLFGFSDTDGSAPSLGVSQRQNGFDTLNADPTTLYAASGETGGSIYWVDIQVTDTAPGGITSYRLWPNLAYGSALRTDDSGGYTIGTEFYVTQACALKALWWFSPPGAASLPSRTLIWDSLAQTAVAGTDNASPSWLKWDGSAASAGNGFIKVDYTGANVTLAAGKRYITSVFHGSLSDFWFADTTDFWQANAATIDAGKNGLNFGPLNAPNNVNATYGQSVEHTAPFVFPSIGDGGANDWTDVEVSPITAAPAPVAYLMRYIG